jgi:hypothetical protein
LLLYGHRSFDVPGTAAYSGRIGVGNLTVGLQFFLSAGGKFHLKNPSTAGKLTEAMPVHRTAAEKICEHKQGWQLFGCGGVELNYEGIRNLTERDRGAGLPDKCTEAQRQRKPGRQAGGRIWWDDLAVTKLDGN